MDTTIFKLVTTGALASVFTTFALFPDTIAFNQNSKSAAFDKIPAILQEHDYNDNTNVASNYDLIRQVRVHPQDALLTAAENTSTHPSELRSLTLENENDIPVFSIDILDPINVQFIDVMVNAIDGKILRIDQDQDDNSVNGKEEHEEEQKFEEGW
jgi:uncharacterized membrane protein YkoI